MHLDLSSFSLALGAGVVAFLNPCGFALLPSYVTHYLGSRTEFSTASWWARGLQGLALGAAVSAGFFTVFVTFGLIIVVIGSAIGTYIPWAALLVGVGLIALAARTLLGHEVGLPVGALSARLTGARSVNATAAFYYFYGIGYALASCGCTLPIFMIYVVGPTLTAGLLSGFLNFVAYASGMTVMMLLLSVSIAYSKGGLDRSLPLHGTLIGLGLPLVALLLIALSRPEIAWSWMASFSGTNRIFLMALAPILVLMLFFQLRRWERATRLLNALVLMLAGGYLIYYQIESGLLSFVFK